MPARVATWRDVRRRHLWLLLLLFALAPCDLPRAQTALTEAVPLGAAGAEYAETIGRRIDTDVTYYDPKLAAPTLETTAPPKVEDKERPDVRIDGWIALLGWVVLGLVVLFFWRYGSAISVPLRARAANPSRQRRSDNSPTDADDAASPSLRAILATRDRRRALILLARSALSETMTANGLLLQSSWTARDALRRLPRTQDHLDALTALVLEAEGVQFGDRDVDESGFTAHLERIRPLLMEQPA